MVAPYTSERACTLALDEPLTGPFLAAGGRARGLVALAARTPRPPTSAGRAADAGADLRSLPSSAPRAHHLLRVASAWRGVVHRVRYPRRRRRRPGPGPGAFPRHLQFERERRHPR